MICRAVNTEMTQGSSRQFASLQTQKGFHLKGIGPDQQDHECIMDALI